MRSIRLPEFPIMAREFSAMGARHRTWVWRTVAAVVFLFLIWPQVSWMVSRHGGGVEILGQGGAVFRSTTGWMFAAIIFGMPVLTADCFVRERERKTLELLLITPLPRSRLLIEKLMSRVVAMVSLLFITLPVLAFAYSLGGVSMPQMVATAATYFCLILIVGSLGILNSVRSRTVVGAVISSWLCSLGVFIFGGCLCVQIVFGGSGSISNWGEVSVLAFVVVPVTGILVPAMLGAAYERLPGANIRYHGNRMPAIIEPPRPVRTNQPVEPVGVATGAKPEVATKTLSSRNPKSIEALLNTDQPLAWRESRNSRQRLTTVGLVAVPIALIIAMMAIDWSRFTQGGMPSLVGVIWLIGLSIMAIRVTRVIPQEASGETLDVLLSTCLSERDIVRQLAAGQRWLMWAVALPILAVTLLHLLRAQFVSRLLYITCTVLLVMILPRLVIWLSLFFSLRLKSHGKACTAMLGAIFAACFLPLFTGEFERSMLLGPPVVLSPAGLIGWNETFTSYPPQNGWYHNLEADASAPVPFREALLSFATSLTLLAILTALIQSGCLESAHRLRRR